MIRRARTHRPIRNLERERDRLRVSARRAHARDLEIPKPRNSRRRRLCENDPGEFLSTYLPKIFYNPFTATHDSMIAAFVDCISSAGWQAVAGPRGTGKTMIALGLTLWALLYGLRRFIVIVAANAADAARNMGNIKAELERNPLLGADFPEVCVPIRALEGANQRANLQTVAGRRTHLKWTGDLIVLPTIRKPGGQAYPASGAIVTSRGIDAAIRGLNHEGRRPDMGLIDDCETRESAASAKQTGDREDIIDADIVNLAGQDQPMALLYLCTLWTRDCLADRFTDPTRKPPWTGRRHKLLEREPTRADLWDKYIELRQRDQIAGDKTGRTAHRFLLDNLADMDAGARVSNLHRYYGKVLPDGSQLQISTLQFCYDIISDTGWIHFNTEYQNIPPAEDAPETAGIDRTAVMTSTNGRPRGILPAATDFLVSGIDVHGRFLIWAVAAWSAGAGHLVDYGVTRVHSPLEGALTDPANAAPLADAIVGALVEVRDLFSAGWPLENTGEVRHLDLGLVDSGYQPQAVYAFCRTGPRGLYRPAKGFGTASGQARYRPPARKAAGRRLGRNWFATRQASPRIWLYNVNADHFKEYVHTGFLLPRDDGAARPGSLSVFGSDPIAHREYADQITAEILTTVYRGGKELTYWDRRRKSNHYLDATALTVAASAILGMAQISSGARAAAERPARGPSAAKGDTTTTRETASGPAAKRKRRRPKMSERIRRR